MKLLRNYWWTVTTGMVLALGLGVPSAAPALSYVSLLGEPSPPEVKQALSVGVDIDVYYTVYSESLGRNEWRVVHFANQHTLAEARALIKAQLAENNHLPAHKQHQITIGWRRRK